MTTLHITGLDKKDSHRSTETKLTIFIINSITVQCSFSVSHLDTAESLQCTSLEITRN